jgi:hypothetical protein
MAARTGKISQKAVRFHLKGVVLIDGEGADAAGKAFGVIDDLAQQAREVGVRNVRVNSTIGNERLEPGAPRASKPGPEAQPRMSPTE